jgi:hypothetical protein
LLGDIFIDGMAIAMVRGKDVFVHDEALAGEE